SWEARALVYARTSSEWEDKLLKKYKANRRWIGQPYVFRKTLARWKKRRLSELTQEDFARTAFNAMTPDAELWWSRHARPMTHARGVWRTKLDSGVIQTDSFFDELPGKDRGIDVLHSYEEALYAGWILSESSVEEVLAGLQAWLATIDYSPWSQEQKEDWTLRFTAWMSDSEFHFDVREEVPLEDFDEEARHA
ncbi:hypothetical protein OIO90_006118, partial [Microbotryomycetes sp. JL221]